MRIALILALVLSSACVSPTASRGEKVATGVTRVAFSVPLITGAASTTIATTLYGVSTLALESSPLGEFTPSGYVEAAVLTMIFGYVGAGVLCAIGFPLLVTGTSLITTTLDEDAGGEPASIRRLMKKTAREVVEEEAEPKVIKRCVEGWDCPVEEEDQ